MRYLICAAALAAIPGAALAQSGDWRYFEAEDGTMLAGVASADGAQLILKCDKKGNRSVYAVVVTTEALMPPRTRYVLRTATYRFDEGAPNEEEWRYQDKTAAAVNSRGKNTLTRFLQGLVDAEVVELRFDPVSGKDVVTTFNVAGARDALARVYESCEDEIPID